VAALPEEARSDLGARSGSGCGELAPDSHTMHQCHSKQNLSKKCAVVPRRARIEGAWTCVSLDSRLDSNKEQEECQT